VELLPSSDSWDNERVLRDIGHGLARELRVSAANEPSVDIGRLSVNNFSFTFSVSAEAPTGRRDLFVKIPKEYLRGRRPTILPITDSDRRMAREEESSLRLLGEQWRSDDLDVRWIHVAGFLPEYNALITDRVFAEEAVTVFRGLDMRRRLGSRTAKLRLRSVMARLGTALARFHRSAARPLVFRLSAATPKLEFYCRELEARSRSPWPARILERLKSLGNVELAGFEARTLKGIDIRNVLLDEHDRIYLLDPGRMKLTFREADIARFLMTYRVLYWGSKRLLVANEPDLGGERAFLESYYSDAGASSPRLLDLFLVKEQLKHWHTALDSLDSRPWPNAVKRQVARVYVNPFYSQQLARSHRSLG
jgi:hypothetical protein